MGVVYGAYDRDLDRKIALKFLHRYSDIGDTRQRDKLMREAQMLARLSHPNVVMIHDVGEIEGRVFLAMEHIDGPALGAWLNTKTRDWRAILRALLQAGEGISAAHTAGVVHRDFKPHNVLIAPGERVVVTDFGLASIESTAIAAGTPAFMAPEVFRGDAGDARSDQFKHLQLTSATSAILRFGLRSVLKAE